MTSNIPIAYEISTLILSLSKPSIIHTNCLTLKPHLATRTPFQILDLPQAYSFTSEKEYPVHYQIPSWYSASGEDFLVLRQLRIDELVDLKWLAVMHTSSELSGSIKRAPRSG